VRATATRAVIFQRVMALSAPAPRSRDACLPPL